MRYSQYKTINELSKSLNEALVYVANTKSYALLEDCLMAMTAISDALINEPGKETEKAKTILSDMYKILEVLDNPEKDIPRLAELSDDLANECKTNLKYKLRVLFVAELGSKWDSMKSVYEAFLERDDCDIDVVLEPIFRATQLPNGETKAEIIYDNWLTPLGINHIPYKQYDMATIQPDITFISQPYESVTVPMFWPENIAKYSKLVYLPYYTANDYEYEATKTSFFLMPIERCSWKIVCQSEQMKEGYEKYASRRGENVIVTGLPKWDYPMRLTKENTPCPEEWKKKIEGKTVFLLNSHFTTVFEEGNIVVDKEFLVKIKDKENVALIWRPHPMTEPVCKVYNEENYKRFIELKKIAETSNNIVFDTSESYAAAFVWSDAMISGMTSLVPQYLFFNKPILLLASKTKNTSIFDFSSFLLTKTVEDREKYMDIILSKKELCGDIYDSLIRKYLSLADGKVGKRVAIQIVDLYKKEIT